MPGAPQNHERYSRPTGPCALSAGASGKNPAGRFPGDAQRRSTMRRYLQHADNLRRAAKMQAAADSICAQRLERCKAAVTARRLERESRARIEARGPTPTHVPMPPAPTRAPSGNLRRLYQSATSKYERRLIIELQKLEINNLRRGRVSPPTPVNSARPTATGNPYAASFARKQSQWRAAAYAGWKSEANS